uniref:CKLF-like MARVEL transmembrane domain-containing protein 4 n=1 Tax=Myxine glutinosa TaxID=7769 RepID=UPI00358F793A
MAAHAGDGVEDPVVGVSTIVPARAMNQHSAEPPVLVRHRWTPHCDISYICSLPGALKIMEMVLLFLGFICSASASSSACVHCSALFFSLFTFSIIFVVTGAMLLTFAISLHVRLPLVNWPFVDLGNMAISTGLLFILSILLSALSGRSTSEVAAMIFAWLVFLTYAANCALFWHLWRQGCALHRVAGGSPGEGSEYFRTCTITREMTNTTQLNRNDDEAMTAAWQASSSLVKLS